MSQLYAHDAMRCTPARREVSDIAQKSAKRVKEFGLIEARVEDAIYGPLQDSLILLPVKRL